MQDLEEAITAAKQAVQSTPDDHPDRAGRLNNLGNKLDDHPDRAGRLNNLGNNLESRYERTGQMQDLDNASKHLQEAWNCGAAVPFHRIKPAARCLQLFARLRGGPNTDVILSSAIQLGKDVIKLLPTVNTRMLNRADQQFVIKTFAGVAADLCAFHLESDNLNNTLLYLEKGRAVILGQLVDSRSDISSLVQQYPGDIRRYEELRDEINRPVQTGKQDIAERLMLKRRREAIAELERCIEEIRRIPGQEQFLQGQTVAQMQECAAYGSIIIINLTTFRSDAIIVTATTIKALNLPKLSTSEAENWLSRDWHRGRRSDRLQKNKEYLDFLSWLWQACVQPVLDVVLAIHRSSDMPRIWWIGTGLATSMPFHAAGTHSANSTDNLYSRAVSSYAPSIKALAYAHSRSKATDRTKGTLLMATMSTTPGSPKPPDLPGVAKEKEKILDITGRHLLTESIDQPSVNRLIERLPHCSIAHFACHGSTDYSDPSNSGLDWLTVQMVSELSLTHARLAYLSACSTAENKAPQLTDEVIHVVSGFQVAGFPHVVGCLWPSNDRVCVEVASGFYTTLLGKGGMRWHNDDAVNIVRENKRSMPLNWAQFVHYGP
ncbi:CHAT domain containing protein [Rhypophila sp. PSN 637]